MASQLHECAPTSRRRRGVGNHACVARPTAPSSLSAAYQHIRAVHPSRRGVRATPRASGASGSCGRASLHMALDHAQRAVSFGCVTPHGTSHMSVSDCPTRPCRSFRSCRADPRQERRRPHRSHLPSAHPDMLGAG
eukprot:scaffold35023_cov30-Tisochrysis_lutea.AAC.2